VKRRIVSPITATIVEETLQGILNVKAFSNEGYELQSLPDHSRV